MDPAQNKSTSQPNSSQPNQTWSPPAPDWSVPPVNLTPAEENKSPQPPVIPPVPTPIPAPVVTQVAPPLESSNPTPVSTVNLEPTTITNFGSDMSSGSVGSPPKKSAGGKTFLIITLLLIVVGCMGAIVYFLLLNKSSLEPVTTNELEVSPVAVSSAQTPALTTSNHELLYIKSSNVYHYSLLEQKETQLTLDGNQQIQYRMPQFAGNLISFVRCDHKSVDDRQPYSCSLIKQQMNGTTPVEIARLDSKANSNGVHIGAQIKTYAWDKSATQAAYLAESMDTNENIAVNLYLSGSASISAIKLDTFTNTPGRGGSPDDTVLLAFSPNGNRLLLDYTPLYPVANEVNDKGTLFVYDLNTKKLVWSLPKTWIAFAHWLDDEIVIAKLQSLSDVSGGPRNLVKINVTKPITDTQSITTIVEAPNWYGIEPLTASTSTSLVFWSLDSSASAGIALEQLDLSTKIKKTLMKNLVKLTVLDKSLLLVNTMKNCDAECGMDVYNGYIPDAVAVYQLDKNALQTLNLATGSGLPWELFAK